MRWKLGTQPQALNTTIYLHVCMVLLACGCSSTLPTSHSTQLDLSQAKQMSGKEISQTFSNVRDDAVVQDTARTTAVNHWHANGVFTNHWRNQDNSGKVTGRWRVANNLRCITIESGLPERRGQETCNPVLRLDDKYITVNQDGSPHGVHVLTPF